MVFNPNLGLPQTSGQKFARNRIITADSRVEYLPGGYIIDGFKTRDADNPDYPADNLAQRDIRPGLLMGKVTATGFWTNSFFGSTQASITGTATSLTLTPAQAVELVRRVGATGTFVLTGPPAAAGVVRQATLTYSAVNPSTGVVTVTAVGVTEVQTITSSAAATGGSMQLLVPKADGTMVLTGLITWNATDATWLAAINTALDAATGVAGGIVATGAAPDTALTFTFSGTGYPGNTYSLIQVILAPTSWANVTVVKTTAGVAGAFFSGSIVSQNDGSQLPRWPIPDDYGYYVPTSDENIPIERIPMAMNILDSQLLPWPADASLKQWIRDQLRQQSTKFVFTELF